jgi:outer membrane protein assembly factor BamD
MQIKTKTYKIYSINIKYNWIELFLNLRIYMKKLLLVVLSMYLFIACSSKDEVQEYNKPAVYWYNKMLKDISLYNLDNADATFTSLESEHRNSPLLSSALMLIADAHMKDEQYTMSIYYYDSYTKRFEDKSLQDYVRYLKIKAKFMSFTQKFRDQKLINETLSDIGLFVKRYPNSNYIHLVRTMQSRLDMSKAMLDIEIANLYTRKDKPEASKYYTQKAKQSWLETNTIQEVKVAWYRAIFE